VYVNQSFITQVAASQMTSAQAADYLVLECPPTYYGPGGAVNSICIECPGGHSALGTGASKLSECEGKYIPISETGSKSNKESTTLLHATL
jgi:hypothetical protein